MATFHTGRFVGQLYGQCLDHPSWGSNPGRWSVRPAKKRYDYPCIEGVKTAYKHRQTSTADEHGQTGNGMATEGQMPCWAISMFKHGHKRAGTFPNTQDYALLCKKE